MRILTIDTSGHILSVALVADGEVVHEVTEQMRNNASAILLTKIDQMLDGVEGLHVVDLIAVVCGPGSYTGIRVSVTVAKTLAYALGKPVVGVSSLSVLIESVADEDVRVAMLDARRDSVFASSSDDLIPEGHYDVADLLARLVNFEGKIKFVGEGALKYEESIVNSGLADFAIEGDVSGSASKSMAQIAMTMEPEEDFHKLSPDYLRKTEAENNLEGR